MLMDTRSKSIYDQLSVLCMGYSWTNLIVICSVTVRCGPQLPELIVANDHCLLFIFLGLYYFLIGKPEGTHPHGRPKIRWEDNIIRDLKEVDYEGD